MSIIIQLFAIAVGVVIICFTVKALLSRTFNEMQTAMWLFVGVAAIVLGLCPGIIDWTAAKLGVIWPPAMLFLFALVGLGFIVFKQTRDINALTARQIELGERVSILMYELDRVRGLLDTRAACSRGVNRPEGDCPDDDATEEANGSEDNGVRCQKPVLGKDHGPSGEGRP